jgi:RluA family pseudouridine synthase
MKAPLQVLYETALVRVIAKPSGLSVLKDNTGIDSLTDLYQEQFHEAPLFVHRLDKGTSGVLLLARTIRARSYLSHAFTVGRVDKVYLAVVVGIPEPVEGVLDTPLEKGRKGSFRIAMQGQGLPSRTRYHLQATRDQFSLLECRPLTGRSHQIRVHLASIGCPLVRDPVYGLHRAKPSVEPDLTLHAWKLTFPDPPTGERVTVVAPLPEWVREYGFEIKSE